MYSLKRKNVITSIDVFFDEGDSWNWEKNEATKNIVVAENEEENKEEEVSEADPSSPSSNEASSSTSRPTSIPVKMRDLVDIYASCNYA